MPERPTGVSTVTVHPGLVDLQVNGYAGFDVNADDVDPDVVTALTHALWAEGVTTYLPTLVSAPEEKIVAALRAIGTARARDPLVAHSIAGVHVEGPALSSEDGARGAHDAGALRDPSLAELDRWQAVSGNLARMVTLAPERAGALEYIAGAVRNGVRVSLGHCAATPEQIRAAAAAGASLSTHLGNGAAPVLARHPNHIWAQLAEDRLTAMFIADGHHVPVDTLTAMIRAKTPDRSVLTSDSAALAGQPAGEYRTPVGGNVVVSADGRLTLAGTELLAGSGKSLRACLDWATAHLPFPAETLEAMATLNPARLIGLKGRVRDGRDVVVLHRHGAVTQVVSTMVAGTEVFST